MNIFAYINYDKSEENEYMWWRNVNIYDGVRWIYYDKREENIWFWNYQYMDSCKNFLRKRYKPRTIICYFEKS